MPKIHLEESQTSVQLVAQLLWSPILWAGFVSLTKSMLRPELLNHFFGFPARTCIYTSRVLQRHLVVTWKSVATCIDAASRPFDIANDQWTQDTLRSYLQLSTQRSISRAFASLPPSPPARPNTPAPLTPATAPALALDARGAATIATSLSPQLCRLGVEFSGMTWEVWEGRGAGTLTRRTSERDCGVKGGGLSLQLTGRCLGCAVKPPQPPQFQPPVFSMFFF